jgi:hypothetical protein
VTRDVTLIDGTTVDSWSEAWRHECEARAILAMPTRDARRKHLDHVERLRGTKERQRLEETALAIWEQRRGSRAAAS